MFNLRDSQGNEAPSPIHFGSFQTNPLNTPEQFYKTLTVRNVEEPSSPLDQNLVQKNEIIYFVEKETIQPEQTQV